MSDEVTLSSIDKAIALLTQTVEHEGREIRRELGSVSTRVADLEHYRDKTERAALVASAQRSILVLGWKQLTAGVITIGAVVGAVVSIVNLAT